MTTKEQKISLLCDMIAFATVDGELHISEYGFLKIIAQDLGIVGEEFNQLFHLEVKSEVIPTEFERIQQFYRLALLMFCDGVLDENEVVKIHELGLKMGLNPNAIKRVLKVMKESPTHLVDPIFLLNVFQEQSN